MIMTPIGLIFAALTLFGYLVGFATNSAGYCLQ
jgi:hypothetical protein